MAREHFTAFAKQLIPSSVFRSSEKMFAELTGPQREAFVFFLWQEAGKAVDKALPHVGVVGIEMHKLAVVGAIKSGGQEVVVLSMPPTEQPNEAVFIAIARRTDGGVSVFFLERCAGDDGGVHPDEAVLAELRSETSRVNHGFAPGLDLAAFKRRLGGVLGVSLDGIETSLPEFDAAAFVAAGGARQRGGGGAPGSGARDTVGPLLTTLLAVRAGVPLLLWSMYMLGLPNFGLYSLTRFGYPLLTLAIVVLLIMWVYQVHARRPGQGTFSAGWAVGVWFFPGFNFILAPMSLGSAWKAAGGSGGGLLALLFGVLWLLETAMTVLTGGGGMYMSLDGGSVTAIHTYGLSIPVPPAIGDLIAALIGFSSLVSAATFGLLWYIVKQTTARL